MERTRHTGQAIENPVSGERITFERTADDTNGTLLSFELELTPSSQLVEEGRTTSKGAPKSLDIALFVREFKDEVRGPYSPGALQRAPLAPLAWAARRRGPHRRYLPVRPALV